jgi:predicted RNA-binding protein with PUA domain
LSRPRKVEAKLVEVSREPYSGKVYNLKVGSQAEKASLGQDQTVVHANGFVVGDGQIQSKYEELAMKQGRRTPGQVPEQWRRDYLLSISRK